MGILDKIKGSRAKAEKERIRKHIKAVAGLEYEIKALTAQLRKKAKWEGRKTEKKQLQSKVDGLKRQVQTRYKYIDGASAVLKMLGAKVGLSAKGVGSAIKTDIKKRKKKTTKTMKKKIKKEVKKVLKDIWKDITG